MSVIVVITYQTLPTQIEAGHQALADLIKLVVEREPDCLGITMHRDTTNPARILLWEEWTTEAAFKGPHLQTAHIKAFMEKARSLYVGAPELSYWSETEAVSR